MKPLHSLLLVLLLAAITLGQAIQPTAPVVLVKPTGFERPFTAADTDGDRGTKIVNAQTAAADGDTIKVYGDATLTSTLGKDGVNWWFAPGATLTTASDELFSDGNAEQDFRITGHGNFVSTLAGTPLIFPDDDDSNWLIECDTIHHQGTATNSPALKLDGTTRIHARESIISDKYDACWVQSGTHYVKTPYLRGMITDNGVDNGNALEFSGGTGYIEADLMTSYGPVMEVQVAVSSTVFRVKSKKMEAYSGGTGIVLQMDVSTVGAFDGVIECPDMVGRIVHTATGTGAKKLRIVGARIDSSSLAAATLTLNGAGIILENCTLVMKASETYAITASAAQTLTVVGDLTITDETGADRTSAVHSNVTIARRAKRDLPVTDGGTGASTASAARTNLAIADHHPRVVYNNGAFNQSVTGTSPTVVYTWAVAANEWSTGDTIEIRMRVDQTAGSGSLVTRAKVDGSIVTGNVNITSGVTTSMLLLTIDVTGAATQIGTAQKLGVNSVATNSATGAIGTGFNVTIELYSADGGTTNRIQSLRIIHHKVKTS